MNLFSKLTGLSFHALVDGKSMKRVLYRSDTCCMIYAYKNTDWGEVGLKSPEGQIFITGSAKIFRLRSHLPLQHVFKRPLTIKVSVNTC